MSRYKIVFLDRAMLAPQIRLRRPGFTHELIEHDGTARQELLGRLARASIAITIKVLLTSEVLEQLPELKLVAVVATGTDCVDKAAYQRLGIAETNIRGYAIHTVPEHTFALILTLRRNLIAYRDDVLAGEWRKSGQFCFFTRPIHDLAGACLGIIGEGALGQRVAQIGKAFGMVPMFAAHKGKQGLGSLCTPWDEVLEMEGS
jgi:glycerate dehydrogenase